MSADDPATDREWLMRIDGKVDQLLICQQDHETRIRELQTRTTKWLGRDGAIVASISGVVTAAGLLIAVLTFWRS